VCSIVIALVLVYLFKSFRVVVIAFIVLGLCVVSTTAIISLLDIRLNSATSLSFGLVLVITVATISHLASQYNIHCRMTEDREDGVPRFLVMSDSSKNGQIARRKE
jgi:predicted RND superfamily exporter protein